LKLPFKLAHRPSYNVTMKRSLSGVEGRFQV